MDNKNNFEDECLKLQRICDEFSKSNQDLSDTLQNRIKICEKYELQIKQYEDRIKKYEDRIKKYEDRISKDEDRISKYKDEIHKYEQGSLTKENYHFDKLKIEYQYLESENNNLKIKNKTLSFKNKSLESRNYALDTKIKIYYRDYQKTVEDNNRLKSNEYHMNIDMQDLKRKLNDKDLELNKIYDSVRQKNEINDELKFKIKCTYDHPEDTFYITPRNQIFKKIASMELIVLMLL